jgi:hypothetical protein
MAVFRVEKTRDYTVMSNYHIKDRSLSLKAKGLLSMMLSLPDEWNYSTRGLAAICKEGVDSIGTALKELEKSGYIVRNQLRDSKGKISDTEYIIYERPIHTDDGTPHTANPDTENPYMDNPDMDTPYTDNPAQLNTNRSITNSENKDIENPNPINPYPDTKQVSTKAASPDGIGKGRDGNDPVKIYKDLIKGNIDYDVLILRYEHEKELIDNIVELVLETLISSKRTLRIASDDYPADLVKGRFLKLTLHHIEFVINALGDNKSKIANIKKYLLAMLFNAPVTIDPYFTALVAHDKARGLI